MGCQDFSQLYLNILNALLLVFSIVILGYSAYLTNELEDFTDAFDEGAVLTPLIFATFMFLVSILGLVAVIKYSKILLLLYLVFATIITIAVLVSGSIVLSFSGLLEDVENERIDYGSNSVEANTIDFALGVYGQCCFVAFGDVANIELPALCGEEEEGDVCVSDPENVLDVTENTPESACEFLEDVEIDGVPIVGNPDVNGGCGGGDPTTFVDQFTQFIADNLRPLGIISIVLSVLMIFDLCTTCVLLWTTKEKLDGGNREKKSKNVSEAEDQANGREQQY